jgi:predicted glutamine amidotransferase
MCRMIVVVDNGELLSLRNSLLTSLVRASESDPYIRELYGRYSHGDGWGALVLDVGSDMRLVTFKSLTPIFKNNLDVLGFSRSSKTVEIIHARAASRNTPVNLFSIHPIEVTTASGYRVLVAHNGSVDKSRLAHIVGYNDREYNLYNDTYFLAKFIAKKLEEYSTLEDGVSHHEIVSVFKQILKDSLDYVISALNLGLLLMREGEAYLLVGSYYEGEDERRRKYYRMYTGNIGNSRVYASSTLVELYNPTTKVEWRELKRGEYHLYKIDRTSIEAIGTIIV